MKKILLLIMPLLAITINSCSKGEDIHFQINYQYSYLDFNARTSLTKYVYIDTNTEGWDYKIVYNTSESSWCEIERISSTSLKITCTVNENENSGRDAYIEFYVNGKVYGTVNIYQGVFAYTEAEEQIYAANNIIRAKYDYVNIIIDTNTIGDYESTNDSREPNATFDYKDENYDLSIPIILQRSIYYSTATWLTGHWVSINGSQNNFTISGYIYTGDNINSNGSLYKAKGDFRLWIRNDDQNISITLTN